MKTLNYLGKSTIKFLPATPIVLVSLAVVCQILLKSYLIVSPFILLYPAIIVGCLFGNRLTNTLSVALGAVCAWTWFMSELSTQQAYVNASLFFIFGLVISWISQFLLRQLDALKLQRDHIYDTQLESKSFEKKLKDSDRRLSTILDTMSDAFFALDKDWRMIQMNAQYEVGVNIRAEERLGKSYKEILLAKGLKDSKYYREFCRAMEEKIEVRFESYNPDEKSWSDCRLYPTPEGGLVAFLSDITAIKTVEQSIHNERENFRNLFKQTPEMVCILRGPDHVFEFVNEAHIHALGFDATGKSVREAQPESVEVHGILDKVYQTGETALLDEIPVTLGDRLRYFNLTYAARFDEAGAVSGVMILGVEVTDQVLSRTSLERVAKLIETMPSPFFTLNANWEVIYWNPASEEVTGKASSEVIGRVVWETFPGSEELDFGTYYKRALAEQATLNFESFYPLHQKWYQVWAFPFESGIAVTFLDITSRKKIEIELEKSRVHYQSLFDSSPLPKWSVDTRDYKFADVNEAAIKFYGYSKKEFLNLRSWDLLAAEDIERYLEVLNKEFYEFTEANRNRFRHRKKTGELVDVEVTAMDVNIDGVRYRVAAMVDITSQVQNDARQKELLKNLEEAKDAAERVTRLKSAFLANMSHEIRTPLGAMIGFADLLQEPEISTEERSKYAGILARNGQELSVIINDILDLSKVEAGHLTFEFSRVAVRQVIDDVLSLLGVKAKEKNLRLEYSKHPDTPDLIVTDSTRLRQILLNIVSNAIKFTHSGHVKISSYTCPHPKDKSEALCIEVADTGIGISDQQKDRLFEMFVQGDGSMTRRFGGTGLGLHLSRSLARELGGDIEILETQEGVGSTFKITIANHSLSPEEERHLISSEASLQNLERALADKKVLIVDDAADNRLLISRYLVQQGAEVEFAENGKAGFDSAIKGDHDIVLMDIQMPEMDGYTATSKLRLEGYNKPIIALTAHAMAEVRKKCMDVGCTDHLPKPIDRRELITTILKHTKKH